MSDANIEKLIMIVHGLIDNSNRKLPEEEIKERVLDAANFVEKFGTQLTDDEIEQAYKDVLSSTYVHIDRGISIVEKEHLPWYMNAKAEIEGFHWKAYKQYLKQKNWSETVINEMDDETDEIMDLLGNPKQDKDFHRLGLCIGDVQSGKTSNYIGLMNKAADAGYKIIILLTGVIEKLRSQTQSRVDEGFTGIDSNAYQQKKSAEFSTIGVGLLRNRTVNSPSCLTSKSQDFKTKIADTLSIKIESLKGPAVFVLKKNKNVLESLYTWLKSLNSESNGVIRQPLLLIDDEADNASINTKNKDEATRINKDIRQLLKLFTKTSYVGYTATPYANIFIDPDTDTDMLNQDLFPRHFIYCLPTPSNYIGPAALFLSGLDEDEKWEGDGTYNKELYDNDDCEAYLPLKHKNYASPGSLPQSLREAILSFFVVNAIRNLRGDEKKHRTMMVNISRFIVVQNYIKDQIADFLKEALEDIENYYMLPNGIEQSDYLKELKKLYEEKFYNFNIPGKEANILYQWETIQHALKKAVAPIKVEAVNGGNASKLLNYEDDPEGKRLIAVGGLSLSRGLTLEGLCISYFYRNSKAYDTLMQMGRWFGYRKDYDDLCRVWMSKGSQNWYRRITLSTRELKQSLKRMSDENRTPEDFGLCVRQDDVALLVTARNKMKTAQDFSRILNLSGTVIETTYLDSNMEVLKHNFIQTKNFIQSLCNLNYKHVHNDTNYAINAHQFLDVDNESILNFLADFTSHPVNFDFDIGAIKTAILNTQKANNMDFKWDVVIAQGRDNTKSTVFGDMAIPLVSRNFGYKKDYKAIQISGANAHLGSKDLSKAGMKKNDALRLEKIHKDKTGKSTSAITYFTYPGFKRNPVLMIYPISLHYNSREKIELDNTELEKLMKLNTEQPFIGLGIGMPIIAGMEPVHANYKINKQKQREIFGIDPDDDFEEVDPSIPED